MADINLLLPKVNQMAKSFIKKCNDAGISVVITSTYRSHEEQDALYAKGRTVTGNVVTNAKGGQSLHNWRVALDFCPVVNGVASWNDKALFTKIGMIGESCGFEWGGRWESFLDLPHLQYTAGYSVQDFQNGKVDYSKFEINDSAYTKMKFAIRDYQVANGIMDFAQETDPYKIKLGPKTLALINK